MMKNNYKRKISDDFIVALLAIRGSFAFSTRTKYNQKREKNIQKIPTFTITMSVDNEDLMTAIKKKLGLKNNFYVYSNNRKDSVRRKDSIVLIVRELNNIEKIVIPYFTKKFLLYRTETINKWLKSIEQDPLVPFSYKKIYWRHKAKVT